MKCVATGPNSSPPRVFRSAVRSELAITAFRTLSACSADRPLPGPKGGFVMFSAM